MTVDIRQATEDDIEGLYALYAKIDKHDEGYFEACFEKDCLILLAESSVVIALKEETPHDKELVGFVILNFEPKYQLYQKLEIPEIQDLNVLPDYRRQGIGSHLVEVCENITAEQGIEQIGISVGLTKDYGPAQRLYTQAGYIPDGYGVTYDRQAIDKGQTQPVNDDLCLMMVKSLLEIN